MKLDLWEKIDLLLCSPKMSHPQKAAAIILMVAAYLRLYEGRGGHGPISTYGNRARQEIHTALMREAQKADAAALALAGDKDT